MATHQDLLDAIARIRTATGDPDGWTAGLSGEDIAVATNPLSTSNALGAVMAKLIAAHPDSFLPRSQAGPLPPSQAQGAAAEAIRGAETALSQQTSAAAQVDLQVLTAVLNAHATHAEGVAALDRLQREIEEAAAARADLDTPAGARAFQRYLVEKLRDIRAVVETAGLDSASKAALAAALANLYTSSTPESVAEQSSQTSTEPDPVPRGTGDDEDSGEDEDAGAVRFGEPIAPLEWASDPLPPFGQDLGLPLSEPAAPPAAPALPAPSVAPPAAGWGGGFPAAAPFGGGMPGPPMPALPSSDAAPAMEPTDRPRRGSGGSAGDEPEPVPDEESDGAGPDQPGTARPDGATTVVLPGGQTVLAPSLELAAVITAAVAGTPIDQAFRQQDITIPEPGTPVTGAVDAAQLVPGDIGLFTDRHALALGNGTVFLDQQIQPIASVTGPGFLGWQHPPQPQPVPMPTPPEPPAPIPSAETAPS